MLPSFREEDFLNFSQSETRISQGGHVFRPINTKGRNLIEDLSLMLPVKFCFIWQSGFRGTDFKKSTNQKQELSMVAMFVNRSGLYRGPSIDASYQISDHLAKQFQRRFLEIDQPETRIANGIMFVNE